MFREETRKKRLEKERAAGIYTLFVDVERFLDDVLSKMTNHVLTFGNRWNFHLITLFPELVKGNIAAGKPNFVDISMMFG